MRWYFCFLLILLINIPIGEDVVSSSQTFSGMKGHVVGIKTANPSGTLDAGVMNTRTIDMPGDSVMEITFAMKIYSPAGKSSGVTLMAMNIFTYSSDDTVRYRLYPHYKQMTDGTFRLYLGFYSYGTTTWATAAYNTITIGDWYYITYQILINDTSGEIEVRAYMHDEDGNKMSGIMTYTEASGSAYFEKLNARFYIYDGIPYDYDEVIFGLSDFVLRTVDALGYQEDHVNTFAFDLFPVPGSRTYGLTYINLFTPFDSIESGYTLTQSSFDWLEAVNTFDSVTPTETNTEDGSTGTPYESTSYIFDPTFETSNINVSLALSNVAAIKTLVTKLEETKILAPLASILSTFADTYNIMLTSVGSGLSKGLNKHMTKMNNNLVEFANRHAEALYSYFGISTLHTNVNNLSTLVGVINTTLADGGDIYNGINTLLNNLNTVSTNLNTVDTLVDSIVISLSSGGDIFDNLEEVKSVLSGSGSGFETYIDAIVSRIKARTETEVGDLRDWVITNIFTDAILKPLFKRWSEFLKDKMLEVGLELLTPADLRLES